jgi:putative DNA primase/helicase
MATTHFDSNTSSCDLGAGFNETDLGNAERLIAAYGEDLRYCHQYSKWLVWDDRRWRDDETGEIMQRASDIPRALYEIAAHIPAQDERKKRVEYALSLESQNKLKAMVELAKSRPGIPVAPGDLDRNPWLLNVLNGTLDLKTGTLLPHDRKHLITKLAPVEYDPAAICPTWDAFLKRVMASNVALIEFLQRITGYALTGDTSEHAMFLLYGTGRNGKSTYLETVRALLGEYAKRTAAETLTPRKGREGAREDIARLRGARFVSASETEDGRKLAESLVKDMTGGDTLAARHLYSGTFEFIPEFKLFLATNHKPIVQGTDAGIWSRINMIPFTAYIPEAERDKYLLDKLRAELPGILAWAVRGCLEWQRNGLSAPTEVRAATEAYRADMDVVGQFLAECCRTVPAARVGSTALYQQFAQWCEQRGEYKRSQKWLAPRLEERGYSNQPTGPKGAREWHGLESVAPDLPLSAPAYSEASRN